MGLGIGLGILLNLVRSAIENMWSLSTGTKRGPLWVIHLGGLECLVDYDFLIAAQPVPEGLVLHLQIVHNLHQPGILLPQLTGLPPEHLHLPCDSDPTHHLTGVPVLLLLELTQLVS